jgi:hypothetical protein
MSDNLARISLLDQIDALHSAIRRWSEHIPQNLPYFDLFFAFAYAELGEVNRANRLVEEARMVMEVPVPIAHANARDFGAIVTALVSNFLFKSFKYRIEQVLAGRPHAGPLSREMLDEFDNIRRRGEEESINDGFKLAAHAISCMRDRSRILEPSERPDVYRQWTKHAEPLLRELAALDEIREPERLAAQVRKLLPQTSNRKAADTRLRVLLDSLSLASRVGDSFVVELLDLVPAAIAEIPEGNSTQLRNPNILRLDVIQRAIVLAGFQRRPEIVTSLVEAFIDLIARSPEQSSLRLLNTGGPALRAMKSLGLRAAIEDFCQRLQIEVLQGKSSSELRARHASQPESWTAPLVTQLLIAGGWGILGFPERASPTLDEVRAVLLDSQPARFSKDVYVVLAQAYVLALGQGPTEAGLTRITELFQRMDPKTITNTFTTASYFSRFHISLVEEVVQVLRGPECEPAVRAAG